MKFKDAFHISTKNIRIHLKRNLLIMAVMGIIFGLVLAINLWFQGMVNCYMELANRSTDGKVIIEATNSTAGMVIDEEQPQATRQEMIADIEAYGGKILGEAEKFGAFGGIVLPEDIVKNAIEVDLAKVPTDAAPILVSTFLGEQLLGESFPTESTSAIKKQKDYEEFRDSLIGKTFTDTRGAKYYVVGLSSGNFHVGNLSFKQLVRGNNDLLNPLLELITTPNGQPIVVDNGQSENWQKGEGVAGDIAASIDDNDIILAVFDNGTEAYKYFRQGKGRFMNVDLPNRTYSVGIIAGVSPETYYVLNIIQTILNIVSVILGVIASVVVIFTSIRLVDQDRQNIFLYYSLGATTGQVRMVYFCYFLELMIGVAILAFSLASIVVLLFSFLNQGLLTIQAELGFNLATTSGKIWYNFNAGTVIIFCVMVSMSAVCTMINNKNLARKS